MKIQLPSSPLTRENYFEFKEYQGKPVINSSSLEHIYPGQGGSIARMKMFFEGEIQKKAAHYQTGQLIHKYLENKNEFAVSPDILPEPKVVEIVSYIFENFPKKDYPDAFTPQSWPLIGALQVAAARTIGYQAKWGDEAIMKKIGSEGEGYWKFLHEATGKHMLSSAQKTAFDGMSASVLNSPFAEIIFHKDALHEVPVLFPVLIDGIQIWCKALLDWILFGKDEMSDIHVVDFKTTSKPLGSFFSSVKVEYRLDERGERGVWVPMQELVTGSYWIYRYYRQMYFYRLAVNALFSQVYPDWQKRHPKVNLRLLPLESVAPFECDLLDEPLGSQEMGHVELDECFKVIAPYYKSLKSF